MPRIPIIERADMNAEQARVYDVAKQSSGIVGGPYYAYIRLPKVFEACQNLARFAGVLGLFLLRPRTADREPRRRPALECPLSVVRRRSRSLARRRHRPGGHRRDQRAQGPGLADARERTCFTVARDLSPTRAERRSLCRRGEDDGLESIVALVASTGSFPMTCLTAATFGSIRQPAMRPARTEAPRSARGRMPTGVVRSRQDGKGIMTKADEDAIREIELQFNEAWGRHDPDGMIESLVDDAQFVTVNGAWTRTRADFRDLMQRLRGAGGPFRSSRRETPERHVRFHAPDVAMMHTRFHIYGDVDEGRAHQHRYPRGAQAQWAVVDRRGAEHRPAGQAGGTRRHARCSKVPEHPGPRGRGG